MAEEKKYSLITLDKGNADEAAPHEVHEVREEETIVVSSARGVSTKSAAGTSSVQPVSSADEPQQEALHRKPTQNKSQSKPSPKDSSQDDEGVPFQRMQTAIIICLIAVIVLFLIYFNFLR